MTTTELTQAPAPSLVREFGEKYTVDPRKVLGLLRDTAFNPGKDKRGEPNPPFTDSEVQAALIIAKAHDLNPFLKEIYLTRTRGKILTIVPIDGWTNIANRHPQYDGCEFEDIVHENIVVAIKCKVYRKDRSHATEVTEYLKECHRGTGPWNDFPARMLRHKAFIQACRYAFSLGGIYDPDEAERIADTQIEAPTAMTIEGLPNPGERVLHAPELDDEPKLNKLTPEVVAESRQLLADSKAAVGEKPESIADLVKGADPGAIAHTTLSEEELSAASAKKLAEEKEAREAHNKRLDEHRKSRADRAAKSRAEQAMATVPPAGGGAMTTGAKPAEAPAAKPKPKKAENPTIPAIFPKRTKNLEDMPRAMLELWLDKLAECYRTNGNDPVVRLAALCPNGIGSLSDKNAVAMVTVFESDVRKVALPF